MVSVDHASFFRIPSLFSISRNFASAVRRLWRARSFCSSVALGLSSILRANEMAVWWLLRR